MSDDDNTPCTHAEAKRNTTAMIRAMERCAGALEAVALVVVLVPIVVGVVAVVRALTP